MIIIIIIKVIIVVMIKVIIVIIIQINHVLFAILLVSVNPDCWKGVDERTIERKYTSPAIYVGPTEEEREEKVFLNAYNLGNERGGDEKYI